MQQPGKEVEVEHKRLCHGEQRMSFQSLASMVRTNRSTVLTPTGVLRVLGGNGLAPLAIYQTKPKKYNPWWSYHITRSKIIRDPNNGYFKYHVAYTCLISDNAYANQSIVQEPMQVHPGLLYKVGYDTWTLKKTVPMSLRDLYAYISMPDRIAAGLQRKAGLSLTRQELGAEVLMDKKKYKDLPTAIPSSYIEAHNDEISIAHLVQDLM